MKYESSTSGLLGLLTIVFITLKLIGTISWSWWWVLAPTWIPFAIFIVIVGIIFIGGLFLAMLKK